MPAPGAAVDAKIAYWRGVWGIFAWKGARNGVLRKFPWEELYAALPQGQEPPLHFANKSIDLRRKGNHAKFGKNVVGQCCCNDDGRTEWLCQQADRKTRGLRDYKAMIAKAKIFKDSQKLIRPMFQAFQANVTAYTVSLLADRLGERIDLEKIWVKQGVSAELLAQIGVWAEEVNELLHKTAGGRMVSEWAKKPECRDAVLSASYSEPATDIPELRP